MLSVDVYRGTTVYASSDIIVGGSTREDRRRIDVVGAEGIGESDQCNHARGFGLVSTDSKIWHWGHVDGESKLFLFAP